MKKTKNGKRDELMNDPLKLRCALLVACVMLVCRRRRIDVEDLNDAAMDEATTLYENLYDKAWKGALTL